MFLKLVFLVRLLLILCQSFSFLTSFFFLEFIAKVASEPSPNFKHNNTPPVRIVFLLTLNGRAVRQVYRLIKALFHRDHYFFIHVDSVRLLIPEIFQCKFTHNFVLF